MAFKIVSVLALAIVSFANSQPIDGGYLFGGRGGEDKYSSGSGGFGGYDLHSNIGGFAGGPHGSGYFPQSLEGFGNAFKRLGGYGLNEYGTGSIGYGSPGGMGGYGQEGFRRGFGGLPLFGGGY